MHIYRDFSPQQAATALAIGNFDGVHRGHSALLSRLVAVAKEKNLLPSVLTFEPHPREFFDPAGAPARLLSRRDKLKRLLAEGIEQTCLSRFDGRLASLSASEFIERILVQKLKAAYLVVGEDFRFGARREGDIACLKAASQAGGFQVEACQAVMDGNSRVSSSAIREALRDGRLEDAERLLGRPYSIGGRVIHGRARGRALGFATANIRVSGGKASLLGVFAVKVELPDGMVWPGIANVGVRPTLTAEPIPLIEVHIFDFLDDLYGQRLEVRFLHKIRDEIRFFHVEDLKARIAADIAAAKHFFRYQY